MSFAAIHRRLFLSPLLCGHLKNVSGEFCYSPANHLRRKMAQITEPTTIYRIDNYRPASKDALLECLHELKMKNDKLQVCVPFGITSQQALQLVSAVYQCCAEISLSDVTCLLYEPDGAVSIKLNEDNNEQGEEELLQYNRAVLGGTFDRLHYGHKLLLSEAALMTLELTVGLTTSSFNQSKTLCELIEPWDDRANHILDFLNRCKPSLKVRVVPLEDIYGPALEPEQELLVVTEETEKNVDLIQRRRSELGLDQLVVRVVELITVEEHKISSSEERKNLIGKLLLEPRQRHHQPYVIGLTGRICSGKSSVASKLSCFGADVIDCDQLAHQVYRPGSSVYYKLVETFGPQILQERVDESLPAIDRKVLGAIVFGHDKNMSKLTSLVWPELRELLKEKIRQSESKVVVIDAAILIQANFCDLVDEVWLCAIDKQTCIRRLIDSRKLLYSEAVSRLQSHLEDEEYLKWANVVLSTKGNPKETLDLVISCWSDLLVRLNRPTESSDSESSHEFVEADDESGDTPEDKSEIEETNGKI